MNHSLLRTIRSMLVRRTWLSPPMTRSKRNAISRGSRSPAALQSAVVLACLIAFWADDVRADAVIRTTKRPMGVNLSAQCL